MGTLIYVITIIEPEWRNPKIVRYLSSIVKYNLLGGSSFWNIFLVFKVSRNSQNVWYYYINIVITRTESRSIKLSKSLHALVCLSVDCVNIDFICSVCVCVYQFIIIIIIVITRSRKNREFARAKRIATRKQR